MKDVGEGCKLSFVIAIVLIGQTGSGKTVISNAVADALKIHSISSGAIAREMAQVDPDASQALKHGEMSPELAMRAEVLARIEAATIATSDFVIDGFPRTLEQLYILESVPEIQPLYFVLEVDVLVCIRRLILRERKNDHPDAVATRFRTFQEVTIPVIEAVRSVSHLLSGNQPLDVLTDLIVGWYDTYKR